MSLSVKNGPILDPGLCRCCRSIKKCRFLCTEYTWMDKKEIYADMIMDCFGILLSHIDSDKDSSICATCVLRLRDAAAFRHQVLQAEEVFLQAKLGLKEPEHVEVTEDSLQEMQKKLESRLKPDVKEDLESRLFDASDDLRDMEDAVSMGCPSDVEEDITVLKSTKQEGAEVTTTKNEDNFTELVRQSQTDDEDDRPLIFSAKKKKKLLKNSNKNKDLKTTRKKEKSLKGKKIKSLEKPTKIVQEKRDTTERDLDYMAEENLLTIIENSFVCPFKNRRNNYYCFYCKNYFPKPEDLREHTLTHDTKPFQLLMGYKKMPKLDITRIDCKLCNTKIDDIEVFKTHISKNHGKNIFFEAPNKMLLFRLTWNNLNCVNCSNVFDDFNALNTHMVEHFSNFTCDMCGKSFLEKGRLDAHLKRHKESDKHACEICGKVFKSNHYKDMHVDIVHKKKAIIRCPQCDECFMSYALKDRHLSEVHGQKRLFPCNLCEKVYHRQKTLTEHQRRNHQKVMRHQCEYCEQRFYLPSRLKEHMATHTGERNYRCEYCEKSYPRLKSLQYHIRTHTNDRRYRCHICGQAFIQNTSLKSHVKSHHPECDLEGCYF